MLTEYDQQRDWPDPLNLPGQHYYPDDDFQQLRPCLMQHFAKLADTANVGAHQGQDPFRILDVGIDVQAFVVENGD